MCRFCFQRERFLSIHAINYTAHKFAKNVLVLLDFKYVSITIAEFLCMVARYDNISPVVWRNASFINYPEYYDIDMLVSSLSCMSVCASLHNQTKELLVSGRTW